MPNLLLEIIDNDIMYYVIIPLITILLEWIKNRHDIKIKNKELGYWMLKCRRLDTFIDISMRIYKRLALILVLVFVMRFCIELWLNSLMSFIIAIVTYIIIGGANILFICKEPKTKTEFLSNREYKKILVIALYIIFILPFFLTKLKQLGNIPIILFGMILLIWVYCLFKFCDIAFILDNAYADIYVKGSETAEYAEAGSIKKQGEWIIVNRHINGYDEEIRIKENDIVRIDYYGGPIITVEKWHLFKRHF